jgi:CHAT domain-containing protein
MDLKVNADLVTMSACSTGRTHSRSNEVPGFVRAFSLWGVPSLIASLWEVDDGATSLLMSSLYEGLRDSPDLGAHLRRAMLKVKEQYAHPVHWGGFILIGKQTLGKNWHKFAGTDERKLKKGALS